MNFSNPLFLLGLLLVPLILFLYMSYMKKKRSAALKFSSLGLIGRKNHEVRYHLPFAILLISIMLIILGLSDPLIPLKTEKGGVNVILVIDDSGSMSASDYPPTRLEAAKSSAEILIKSLKLNDNVGIVVFESGVTTAAYLTPFKDKAIEKLRSISQKQGATAIGDGLSMAVDMATSIPNKRKVIILMSDGVNNAGVISPQEAVKFAVSKKIQVTTVALGSSQPVVLGYDFFGNPQYADLDEKTLQWIAEQTGGRYYKSVDKNTLDEIYRNIGNDIQREYEDTSIKDWFFISALVLLLLNAYIIYGKFRIVA